MANGVSMRRNYIFNVEYPNVELRRKEVSSRCTLRNFNMIL